MLFRSRKAQPTVRYLTAEEIRAILAQPDASLPEGRRDVVLLSVLYDTGARVQEVIDLTVRCVRLEPPATVLITGKGNKTRRVPLMTRTAVLLKTHLHERCLLHPEKQNHPLFFNRQQHKLTRAGVTYILSKYVETASLECSSLPNRVTPHIFRHSKAMHLLQANINLVYIRDILGRTDIRTTEVYVRADTEMKRQALEKTNQENVPEGLPSWQKDESLLGWLKDLCRNP